MHQHIALVTLVVRDYEEAIAFYRDKLGFAVVDDTRMGPEKRWVVVAPLGDRGPGLLLAKAATPEQADRAGDQTGGRVFLFLHSDDFHRDYESMRSKDVRFLEPTRDEPYGTVAVWRDIAGNLWDLLGDVDP